jgi:CPA2 family monovalent cation:H+ antiporter-2
MEQELITLGILFFFALVGGILAAKFKQPILLGLLLVGAFIGPKALGLIHDEGIMDIMIEFGAILMLFVIGLEFDISKLQKIGIKAIIIAVLNSAILTFVGFVVSLLLGFTVQAALFIGVILAFGSTVVIVKILENKGLMDRQEVPLLIAILIIEDILAVIVITFFSGITDKSTGILGNIETLIISAIILILGYMLFVKFIKPLLAALLKNNASEEITTFTALALCAGFAYFAYSLKLSPAVGAFMAGSIVASLPDTKNFEKAIAPYNLIISSFFFIAIGTLIDFTAIKENIMIILVLVATVVITKIIAFSGLVYLFANMKGDKMFFSSIAMFSVGEFSLLVAKESAHFSPGIDLVSISAAIVAISAVFMSIAINYSDKVYEPTMDNLPYKIKKKMEQFAAYIQSVSEELDLDNKYSKGLKKNVFGTLIGTLIVVLAIFAWRKIGTILMSNNASTMTLTAGYLTTTVIITIGLFYIIFRAKNALKSLSEVFANATNARSVVQSRIVVKRAFFAFTLLGVALFWPFAMFLGNIPTAFVTVSFVLLIIAIWQLHKIARETHNESYTEKESFPIYKKVNNNYHTYKEHHNSAKNINNGWKI